MTTTILQLFQPQNGASHNVLGTTFPQRSFTPPDAQNRR
jgi:hypothetical protein